MNDEKLEKYLNKVNEEKVNKGLENFVPLYPMLKIKDNKLYVVVMLVKEDANVWDMNAKVVPEYEVLIDPLKEQVLSFSKTNLNDFKNTNNEGKMNKEKEISKYTVQKTLEYKNYLLEDVKNEIIDRFGKITNEIDVYMHEELFEKMAEQLGINNIIQTKNDATLIIKEDLYKNLKVTDLFINASNISRNFRFKMQGKNLLINLI